jgi:hypothetical protein
VHIELLVGLKICAKRVPGVESAALRAFNMRPHIPKGTERWQSQPLKKGVLSLGWKRLNLSWTREWRMFLLRRGLNVLARHQ